MSQMTPPVTPEFDPMAAGPPGWPKVVGIISTVWGSLSVLCGFCGVAWVAFLPQFSAMMEKEMGEPLPAAVQAGLMVVGLLCAVLLLWAGIATLMRRRMGRPLHLAYGALTLLNAIPSLVLGFQQQSAADAWVAANPGSKWAAQHSPAGLYIAIAMTAVFLIWPVFCLVWFAPARRSPEVGAEEVV